MKKVISVVTALLIATMAFAGCAKKPAASSSSSNEKASLTFIWWGNQTRNDRTQKVIQQYMTKNPNVTIQPEFVDWASYWNKLATQEAANSTPDIIQMDYAYIDQYVGNNLLLALDPYFKNGEFDTTNIPKDILSSGVVNKKTYAVSLGSNVWSMVYDPAVLQKANITAPTNNWTWDDFDKIVEDVYKATGIAAAPMSYTDGSQWLEYVAREKGQSLYSKDGKKVGFDQSSAEAVYNRLLSHTKDGSFLSMDKVASITSPDQDPICSGKAWLTATWSNQFVAMANASKRPLVMINWPIDKGDKELGLYNKPSQFISIAASTKYKDASVKFCNYFENTTDSNSILLGERGVPTNTKVLEAIKSSVDSMTAQTFDYVNMCNTKKLVSPIDPPPPTASSQVLALSKTFFQKVGYQKESPSQAAADFISQANSVLTAQ